MRLLPALHVLGRRCSRVTPLRPSVRGPLGRSLAGRLRRRNGDGRWPRLPTKHSMLGAELSRSDRHGTKRLNPATMHQLDMHWAAHDCLNAACLWGWTIETQEHLAQGGSSSLLSLSQSARWDLCCAERALKPLCGCQRLRRGSDEQGHTCAGGAAAARGALLGRAGAALAGAAPTLAWCCGLGCAPPGCLWVPCWPLA